MGRKALFFAGGSNFPLLLREKTPNFAGGGKLSVIFYG
jgi:hypothetical protein